MMMTSQAKKKTQEGLPQADMLLESVSLAIHLYVALVGVVLFVNSLFAVLHSPKITCKKKNINNPK